MSRQKIIVGLPDEEPKVILRIADIGEFLHDLRFINEKTAGLDETWERTERLIKDLNGE